MKVLLFSSLYPSSVNPIHGIFVETRLQRLLETCRIEAKVVAPVPWFPSKSSRFGEYSKFAAVPHLEMHNGVEVHHPRYFLVPKIGMNFAPFSMAISALRTIKKLQRDGFDFDLVDAHYYYPDGVAAGLVARWLKKPFVVTARGTDLSLIPDYSIPRRLIVNTAAHASASIGVCKALMDTLGNLGADSSKLHTLRNGVDLEKFVPESRGLARKRLGLRPQGVLLLSVGHLVERKGHHIAIEALAALPNATLMVAGSGEQLPALKALAKKLGVEERVVWAGVVPQDQLKWWYSAADALVLCSSREGWANVLLEAMACGTPVVATDIWGTPEVVATKAAGRLMKRRDAASLVEAWNALCSELPTREATREYAETFSWTDTTLGQLSLFEEVLGTNHR